MTERDPADHDPAMEPVEEAGGGESEGFEQAEQELIEQAEHGDAASEPFGDAFPPEEDAGEAHGEPDQAATDDRDDES
jgi:hypothetical protein